MRLLLAATLVSVALVACSGDSGRPTSSGAPSASQTPSVVRLSGYLSTPVLGTRRGCQAILYGSDVTSALSQGLMKTVEDKTIMVRDDDAHVLGTARTGSASLKDVSGLAGQKNVCLAYASYELRVPSRSMYLFSVVGVEGAPAPVSFAHLDLRGFKCNLHVVRGHLLESNPCEGGGWIDALGL